MRAEDTADQRPSGEPLADVQVKTKVLEPLLREREAEPRRDRDGDAERVNGQRPDLPDRLRKVRKHPLNVAERRGGSRWGRQRALGQFAYWRAGDVTAIGSRGGAETRSSTVRCRMNPQRGINDRRQGTVVHRPHAYPFRCSPRRRVSASPRETTQVAAPRRAARTFVRDRTDPTLASEYQRPIAVR